MELPSVFNGLGVPFKAQLIAVAENGGFPGLRFLVWVRDNNFIQNLRGETRMNHLMIFGFINRLQEAGFNSEQIKAIMEVFCDCFNVPEKMDLTWEGITREW